MHICNTRCHCGGRWGNTRCIPANPCACQPCCCPCPCIPWPQPPAISYTVTYLPNGGTGSHVDANLAAGTEYTVRSNGSIDVTRPGYLFTGWNTTADGSGTAYFPGDQITIQRDLTLYAQWEAEPVNSYIVTYHRNINPSASYQAPPVIIGSPHTILSYSATGLPYPSVGVFLGWNTQPDGSGAFYSPGESIAFNADTDLYAQWLIPN